MTDPYEGQLAPLVVDEQGAARGWCVTRDRLHEWRLQMDTGTFASMDHETPTMYVYGVYYCVHCLRFRYVNGKMVEEET